MQTARRNQGDNSGGQTTPKIKSRASHNAQASIKLPAPREAIQRVQQWNEALNGA
jgi:hypothetical protein